MKKNNAKTNAMRILDGLSISYNVREYDDDGEHELSRGAAAVTAQKLSEDAARVFKTIVMASDENELFIFCQSATTQINLKKARAVTGAKKIEPLKIEKLQKATGYIRGGCSPLGMTHSYPTFIDESAELFDTIFVSAGVRGLQLELSPQALAKACNAKFVDLAL